jgi:hypothetical protein
LLPLPFLFLFSLLLHHTKFGVICKLWEYYTGCQILALTYISKRLCSDVRYNCCDFDVQYYVSYVICTSWEYLLTMSHKFISGL